MQHIGHYMGSHLSEEWQTLKLTLASLDTVIFSTAVLSVCVCVCRACGFLLQLKVCIPQLNGQVLYICYAKFMWSSCILDGISTSLMRCSEIKVQ